MVEKTKIESIKPIKKGKINISYYLHTKNNGVTYSGKEGMHYPVYIKLIVKRQNTTFKSIALQNQFSTVEGFKSFLEANQEIINKEKFRIEKIITDVVKPFDNPDFNISAVFGIYNRLAGNLYQFIDYYLKMDLQAVLMLSNYNSLFEIIDFNKRADFLFKHLKEVFPSFENLVEEFGTPHNLTLLRILASDEDVRQFLYEVSPLDWMDEELPDLFKTKLDEYYPEFIPAIDKLIKDWQK